MPRFQVELDEADMEAFRSFCTDRGLTQTQYAKRVILEAVYGKRIPSLHEIARLKSGPEDGAGEHRRIFD